MKMWIKNNIKILAIVFVVLILLLLIPFLFKGSSKIKDLDMSEINYSGNIFDSSEKLVEDLDTKKDCIFDLDVFAGKKICFDVLDVEEARIDTNFKIIQTSQDFDFSARNNNVDNGLDELEIVNNDYETFKDMGYFNRKYKIASTSLEDYNINIYNVVYGNDNSSILSKLFIFINNDSNHILLTYYSKNGQISDKIINKLIRDISIKSNNEEYSKEEIDDKYTKYTIENSCFYKIEEVDGEKKFVFKSEEDADAVYALDLLFDAYEYQIVEEEKDFNYVTLKQKDNNYSFRIKLFSGDYQDVNQIIQYSYMGYENVDFKNNYKIDNKEFLKVEYIRDNKKHVDYYYLYQNGMYVTALFEADEDYIFNYHEIEKLLEFDIYQL